MRHRVQGTAIGRDTQHRSALIRNLLISLFEHGSIETTELKAKVVKRMADKVITKGKPGDLAARRNLESFFGQRQIVNLIMGSILPAVTDRTSGFTRSIRLGRRRGDDANMMKVELVSAPIARVVEPKVAKVAKAKTVKPAKKAASTEVAAEDKKTAVKSSAKPAAPAKKAEKAAKPAAKKVAAKPKTAAKAPTKAKSKTK